MRLDEECLIEINSRLSVESMEFNDPNYIAKAPKKERTQAQKEATAKAFATLKAKREARNAVVAEVNPELVTKTGLEPKKKEVQVSAQTPAPVLSKDKVSAVPSKDKGSDVMSKESMFSDEMIGSLVKRLASEMAKPKKKVVVIEDSSSSEEEVIIRRKKEKPVVKPVVKETVAVAPVPEFKSTGSRVLDKLLYTKF